EALAGGSTPPEGQFIAKAALEASVGERAPQGAIQAAAPVAGAVAPQEVFDLAEPLVDIDQARAHQGHQRALEGAAEPAVGRRWRADRAGNAGWGAAAAKSRGLCAGRGVLI